MPPIITDIDLSVDDKFLYVSCWGTGELKQFYVHECGCEGGAAHGGLYARSSVNGG